MADGSVRVALLTEVFFEEQGEERLGQMLAEAKALDADIAVLPELPLNRWAPGSKEPRDEDAEDLDGPRQTVLSTAAATVEIAVVGGAIIRDPDTGTRYNTALLFGSDGACQARYRKIHLPEAEGYWETSHYEPGRAAPEVIGDALAMPAGLQICSDVNRPQGFQILAAGGAEVVFAPRATPPGTYDRWRLILRANAIMAGAYVISVNRPRPENGASIGGASLAIGPSGEVLAETTDPLVVVHLKRDTVAAARLEYPGYLTRFPSVYAEGWDRLV